MGVGRYFSKAYALEHVRSRHADIALLICSYVTGMVDAVALENWGAFVGMQTGMSMYCLPNFPSHSRWISKEIGARSVLSYPSRVDISTGNTVILGLSVAALPITQTLSYATTLVSIGSFLVGSFLAATISRQFPLNRLKVTLLFLSQALLIVIAAGLCSASGDLVPTDLLGEGRAIHIPRILIAIWPLALQSGIQIASSRILGFNELPVNVLTSSYADLMGDKDLFVAWNKNPKRNRRMAGMVLVLTGAMTSAGMMRHGVPVYKILWMAMALKMCTAILCWVCLKPEEVAKEQVKEEA
jgi:uncharacterized membrane protein YoaK (UPF0700 family)